MNGNVVPAALRERLGNDATIALMDVFERARGEWRGEMIDVCTLRFERRLVEEVSSARTESMQGDAALRQEVTELGATLRTEMAAQGAVVRNEISVVREELARACGELRSQVADVRADLRHEIAQSCGALRQEITKGRVDLIKWCFIFWVGQLTTLAGLVALALRTFRTI